MVNVHATAIVENGAELAEGVEVGPYAVIGAKVRVGRGTSIGAHAVLAGNTSLGADNRIFPFSSIGTEPQDKKYAGEDTQLVIGDGNLFREHCLINTGTVQGGGVTRIGSNNWIMGYVHVAHDCVVGSNTILANAVQLAGHVQVADHAIIGGMSAVHQFVRVGVHTMCGGGTILLQDLPPYVMCSGNPAQAHGVHVEGLRRRGFSAAAIAELRRAYRTVDRENLPLAEARATLESRIAELAEDCAAVLRVFTEFLAVPGRGVVR